MRDDPALPMLIAALLFLVGACNREPSFDQRFDATAAKLSDDARAMQNEMNQQLTAARAANGAAQ